MTIRSPLRAPGLFALLALLLPGCGAQMTPKQSPSSQARPPPEGPSKAEPPRMAGEGRGFADPPPPPPPPGTTSSTSPAATGQPRPPTVGLPLPTEPAMMTALLAVEQEAMQLEAAMTSCDLACRALGSLERAARVVCDLEQGDERPRCEMARSRLRGARARVRAACGQCSGGPTTDPDAPMGP